MNFITSSMSAASMIVQTKCLNTRSGRAGEILNPFRGLSLRNSFPISPFAQLDVDVEEEEEVSPSKH